MRKIIFFFLSYVFMKYNFFSQNISIVDSLERQVTVPEKVEKVICSGSGCLRLLVYLQAQDKIVGVDSIEARKSPFDARVYALANPQFKNYPVFGEFRGFDNPELILALPKLPQVIFKTYSTSGTNPVELQQKTGIPVIVLNYGDLGVNKEEFYNSLKIMAKVVGKEKRAQELIDYIENTISDLHKRTANIKNKKKCYIGGVALRGPQAFNSTEPAYPVFKMINAINVAFDEIKNQKELSHAFVSKEMILQWDPEVVFIDLATLQSEGAANALNELKNDPVYKELTSVKKGEVYGVLPYNWYTINYESVLANAYYIGKILYPESFKDIDPVKKAREIFTFFVGKDVFDLLNKEFKELVFKKIELN